MNGGPGSRIDSSGPANFDSSGVQSNSASHRRYCASGCKAGSRAHPIAEEFFAQRSFPVFGLHQTAPLQQRNHSLDEIGEGAGRSDIAEIEPIHSELDPFLEDVRETFGSSRDHTA